MDLFPVFREESRGTDTGTDRDGWMNTLAPNEQLCLALCEQA